MPDVRVTNESSRLAFTALPSNQDITWLGDTAGMAADADGVFHLLWIDSRAGVRQVYTAAVRVETGN